MLKYEKFLFLTTSPLAANPRLRKELLFYSKKVDCSVIYVPNSTNWTHDLDEQFIKDQPLIEFIALRNTNLLKKLVYKSIQIVLHIWPILAATTWLRQWSSNPQVFELYQVSRKQCLKLTYNRLIAHNLGAFYPARKLAKEFQIPLQLDVEDYHPGEQVYYNKKHETNYRIEQMNLAFQCAQLITFASEGIFITCLEQLKIPEKTIKITVNNGFSQEDFKKPSVFSGKIKIVWFSQYINHSRGLESLLSQLHQLSTDDYELHLVGNAVPEFLNQFQLPNWVIIHPPMSEQKLHEFLSLMDVGLALEPGKDLNNTIALSNKIIAYAQAGLYVLATNTIGQKLFLEKLVPYGGGQLIESQEDIISKIQQLEISFFSDQNKNQRFNLGRQFSWENESQKLASFVE